MFFLECRSQWDYTYSLQIRGSVANQPTLARCWHTVHDGGPTPNQPVQRPVFASCAIYLSANTNICITFIQRRPNVFDVGPTSHKCYTNVLCLLGCRDILAELLAVRRFLLIVKHTAGTPGKTSRRLIYDVTAGILPGKLPRSLDDNLMWCMWEKCTCIFAAVHVVIRLKNEQLTHCRLNVLDDSPASKRLGLSFCAHGLC